MTRLVAATLLLCLARLASADFLSGLLRDEDARLNTAYKALAGKLSGGDLALLKDAEKSWLAFRENDEQLFLKVAKRAKDDDRKEHYLPEVLQARTDELSSVGAKVPPNRSTSEKEPAALEADQQLNKIYRDCLAACPQELIPKFKEIQAQWLVFRDLHRKLDGAVRHGASPDFVLRDLTLHRKTQLTHYLMLFVALALPAGQGRGGAEAPPPSEAAPDIFRFAK